MWDVDSCRTASRLPSWAFCSACAGLAAASDVLGVTLGGIVGHALCTGGQAARRGLLGGRPRRASWLLQDSPAQGPHDSWPALLARCLLRPLRSPRLLCHTPTCAGAAVLGGKHLAEHIHERMVAYL